MTRLVQNLLRNGLPPGSWAAYGFAVNCFAIATLVRLIINPVNPNIQSFATYYPAVLFAAFIGGGNAGLLVMGLGVIVGWWAFLPPYFVLHWPTQGEIIDFVLFVTASLVIIWGSVGYRHVLWRLNEEEHFREATVNELAHRVKNNFATVYAVLRHELRTHPDIWEKVSGRLHALAATDEFVRNSVNETASLRDILAMEFSPYDTSRFFVTGPDIQLSRKLAIILALMLHELATNAAKHGALSNIDGRVAVSWKIQGDCVQLEWAEQGGPEVLEPRRRGFGRALLEHGLAVYGGTVELFFVPSGLSCKLSFSTSESGPLKTLAA